MDHFQRRQGVLCAEEVALSDVARDFGTPTYCYSRATLTRHVQVLTEALRGIEAMLCYAVKANGNLGILDVLRQAGCGFDAVSEGELWRVRQVGGAMSDTILSGVGKTGEEIRAGLQMGVRYISAESREEVRLVSEVAQAIGISAHVSLRINPEVDAKTHPYISTGMAENKFGVPQETLPVLLADMRELSHVSLVGLSCHIGSQITSLSPFEDAARILAAVTSEVEHAGFPLTHIGMGGGLGIPYAEQDTPPSPAEYGACLKKILSPLGKHLLLEPGRVIVGNAGVLLAKVVRIKRHGARTFVLLDCGMNDLLRPALYGAHHQIEWVQPTRKDRKLESLSLVGPVCESADTFAKALLAPVPQPGDLVAIRSAGAYGAVMASPYNGRPRAAEVLCQGNQTVEIGRRERIEELWRLESIAPAP